MNPYEPPQAPLDPETKPGPFQAHEAVPVFQVSNLERAIRYYIQVLGFTEDFRFGDYAGLSLHKCHIHLSGHSIHNRPVGGGTAYFFCEEVDDYYDQITKRGASVKGEPKNYEYGMRDFMAVDPDGNHIGFGCPVEST